MPRLPRPVADGLTYHALNRGNNRQAVFHHDDDYRTFLASLRQTRARYPFDLYAYCLMPNHFHLVLAPHPGQSISRILQSLTVAHTWHFHRQGRSSGHVWQGRFKSPVIAEDEHLLTVLRYVEANPRRANLVDDLALWRWSSFGHHAGLHVDDLVSVAPTWERLGADDAQRHKYWRRWLHQPLTAKELAAVRHSITTGRPFGSAAWATRTAQQLGLRLSTRPRGRPRKREI